MKQAVEERDGSVLYQVSL